MSGGGLGARFWTLWSSFTSANLGDGLTLVGFPLLAVNLTDDARLIALVAAARFGPFLIVSLPAGVLIDRHDRRKIAIAAQILRAGALLAVGAATFAGAGSILWLCVTAFVVGVAEVLTDGGLPAVVRDVVDPEVLGVANSRLVGSETVSNNFIGPPLGALLFKLEPALPLFSAAALYLIAGALLFRLPGRFVADAEQHQGDLVAQLKSGLGYVWGHHILRPLAIAVAVYSFAGAATNSVLVLLAIERLGLSELQYGLLLTVDAAASVAMSFFVMRLVGRTSYGTSMQVSVAAFTVHAVLLGTVVAIPVILAAMLLAGISDPTWNIISATVRQRLVDDQIFGRMMTAYLFISWSLHPVGSMVGGIIAEAYGPEWVYVMAAVLVGSLLVWSRPLFHRVSVAMANAAS